MVSSNATTPTAMMATANPAFASLAKRSAGLIVAARVKNRRVMPWMLLQIGARGEHRSRPALNLRIGTDTYVQ
jgi:hypothetical protein